MARDDSDLERMQRKLRALAGRGATRAAAAYEPVVSFAKVEQRRDKKNSHAKGSSYERKIAKKLATWSGEHIRRTPQSGGWSSARFGVTGDLVCANEKWPFHVECKKREGWCLDDLITGARARDTRSIAAWWTQTVSTCPPGKWPTLIFARNNQPDLMLMLSADYSKATGRDCTAEFLPMLRFSFDGLSHGNGDVVILALDDYLAKAKPPKGCKNRKSHSFSGVDLVRSAHIKDNI